jgi:hypothetical protein
LSCRWNCLSCRIRFISSSMQVVCCLRMQIIWHTAFSSSHHATCCCHHSVSIARSRLMASDFIFYPKPLYKLLHQSFFYSFITILPSESGVALEYSTIFTYR